MSQTSYSLTPVAGREGMRFDCDENEKVVSRIADTTLIAGKAVVKAPTAPYPAVAADDDAILGTTSTAASLTTVTSLTGIVGSAAMYPPRKLTLTASNHADFDATTWTIVGTGENDATLTETFSMPNGGNTVLSGKKEFKTVVSVSHPAQSGTGGAYKVGVQAASLHVPSGLLPGFVVAVAPRPANAADIDAFVTTHATAASVQALVAADFNGVVGTQKMFPPRKITFVLNSHADWDATTAVVVGLDKDGNSQTENLTIPDGGNTTLTTTNYYAQLTSFTVPAQSGTNGSYTIGIASGMGEINGRHILGLAAYDAATPPESTTGAGYEYAKGDVVPVVRRGQVWVKTENACKTDDLVYVRVVATGSEETGSFRSDSDSGDAVVLRGASFLMESGIAGLNVLELDL